MNEKKGTLATQKVSLELGNFQNKPFENYPYKRNIWLTPVDHLIRYTEPDNGASTD